MSDETPLPFRDEGVAQEAAAWVLRIDRGLSSEEQERLSAWLAADPRHGAQLARHRRHWRRLDALAAQRPDAGSPPDPDLLAPPQGGHFLRWAPLGLGLAAAAALAFGLWVFRPRDAWTDHRVGVAPVPAAASVGGPRVLPDGSTVELNRDGQLAVAFTPAERRVRLVAGEAHFFVQKNPARPFIVEAGGIAVRAVGTAFDVRLDAAVVEVLVTEGVVRVDGAAPSGPVAVTPSLPIAVLEACQRAAVPLDRAQPLPPSEIATLTPAEIERRLDWQHRLVDFTALSLGEIVAEFNRRNVIQLVVVDPELAAIRLNGSLRSDNIDGFVRLLEAGFGARAERRSATEILLRKAK